jgi:ribulose-phosphate 3-epimerase
MAIICPTITATDQATYTKQLYEIKDVATRIHFDISDGIFSPVTLLTPQNIALPAGVSADIHVMHQKPNDIIETLIALRPQLIIFHVESDDLNSVLSHISNTGIKVGLALLQDTPASQIRPYIEKIDHVLIFSGNLGHFGGVVDLTLLSKIEQIKNWRAELEIGWDGGINAQTVKPLVVGGVDVLNVGGAIHNQPNPAEALKTLDELIHATHA